MGTKKKESPDELGDLSEDKFLDFKEQVNKAIGEQVVYMPKDDHRIFDVSRWSTGILSMDIAMGGGIAEGKNIYLLGPPSTCKSTAMYLMMAEITNRKDNNKVFLEDVENSFDVNWAAALGVNMSNIQVSSCAYMEKSIDVIALVMESGIFAAVFLDSLAALSPKKVVEGSAEDSTMGIEAKAMSRFFKNLERHRITGFKKTGIKTTFIYSNQIRQKIGSFFGGTTEPCGEAPKFYASIRIKLSNPEALVENEEHIGGRFPLEITKNKTAPAFKKGSFVLFTDGNDFGKINNEEALINYAEKAGIIIKKGSWYSYDGQNIAQGLINTAAVIKEMPAKVKNDMLDKIVSILYPNENMNLAFRFKEKEDGLFKAEQEERCEDNSQSEGEEVC
jgi:recombination protein RecA